MIPHPEIRHSAYIALGSSLGDRLVHLRYAVDELDAMDGSRVVKASPVYQTAPAGGIAKEDFYNACIELETNLSPRQLLDTALHIESATGRMRENPLDDRTLDIDILFYDDLIIDDAKLVLPHPRFEVRLFVLQPLFDIAADFVDPKSGLNIRELLLACPDRGGIERMPFRITPNGPRD